RRPPISTLFPYTTLFRSIPSIVSGILVVIIGIISLMNGIMVKGAIVNDQRVEVEGSDRLGNKIFIPVIVMAVLAIILAKLIPDRSEEHTSELQSRRDLVC